MNRPRMHTPMAPAPPSSLSLGLLPLPPAPAPRPPPPDPIDHVALALARVRPADIAPFDGASGGAYVRAVEALSGSLMRHNAAIIEVGSEGAVLIRCALESARMYFKAKVQCGGGVAGGGKSGQGVYTYRAGSGAFLEDAMVISCGHSFGGYMLRKVIETGRCTLCHEDIDPVSLIPNLALRAAATAVKTEDDRRLFHNASLRKRRKEVGEQLDALNRSGKE